MTLLSYPLISLSQLEAFLREDAPWGDITSQTLLSENMVIQAAISFREEGVLAGADEISRLFLAHGVEVVMHARDGELVSAQHTIATLHGSAHEILLIERTALNLLSRMSGIATKTRAYVDLLATKDTHCRIAATRKTAPGLRMLDKKAAMLGGADPHRYTLSDAVLMKDTHRMLIDIEEAVLRAKSMFGYVFVEIEVESVDDGILAARAGADAIMADNMSPKQVMELIDALRREDLFGKVLLEVSGGISEKTLLQYAGIGVDRISIGALTHSVTGIDVALEVCQ
ncbi:MAG: carboxylating nicotinate-nucleotide diphosphorylase [Methanomicrobiales archaeon]|nr:carboxylating nicotinate-nucleotide diphosphorylase [Methanomicrobiales archaeon]